MGLTERRARTPTSVHFESELKRGASERRSTSPVNVRRSASQAALAPGIGAGVFSSFLHLHPSFLSLCHPASGHFSLYTTQPPVTPAPHHAFLLARPGTYARAHTHTHSVFSLLSLRLPLSLPL